MYYKMMISRNWDKSIGAVFTVSVLVCSSFLMSCQSVDRDKKSNHSEKPNMVVVLVDDLRWDELGVTGHNYIKTPHIDRIASEGILFKNAFATTPLCSPSRASFLTGQYAHSHGIIDNTDRSKLSHRLQTFPAKLDTTGYETAFIGKWHMGNDNTPRPGFNFWAGLKGQGRAEDPEFNINGNNIKEKGYVTDILTEYSLDFISQKREEAFLLYLSHKGLHPNLHQADDGTVTNIGAGGFVPAERHEGRYQQAVFERRPNAFVTPKDKPALMREVNGLPTLGRGTATPEKVIRDRAEMLMAIDEGVGKITETLESMGELNNTVIVFASDHGYWYGEHGLYKERRLAYEEGLRIPLIIRYPPLINEGITADQMVLNIDIAPTLIELANGEPNEFIEGKSLLPLLDGTKSEDWRTSFLIEYYTDSVWPRVVNMGYKAIRTKRYKYIRYNKLNGMNELYDLKMDPYELTNQIHNPDYKSIRNKMQKSLKTYIEK